VRRQEGTATIVTVAAVAVLLLALGGAVAVADLVATGSRVATAADLAALAAADAAAFGPATACRRAAEVAAANRAVLMSCRLSPPGDPLADADVVTAAWVEGPMRAVADRLGVEPPLVRERAVAGPARTIAVP
jgi:secretion/DNA translocation related TadE-like protein